MKQSTDRIPFHRPSVTAREEEAVLRVLRSGWITTGKEALAFEEEFAKATGSPRSLACCSGTAALHLALEAFGVGPGTTVLTSAYTFTASAEAARYLGAEVRLCDVAEGGRNIDPAAVEEALARDPSIRAVVPVHIAGEPCDMEPILAAAGRRGAAVIEDAAHAFPARTPLGMAGAIGDAGFYSFYATKTLSTGEGGMLSIKDPARAERAALMRLHGIDKLSWDRYTSSKASWRYSVVEAGYKYNMTDLMAAMGRVQLERAADLHAERRRIAALYLELLADRDWLELPRPSEAHAWHLFIVSLRPGALSIGRDELVDALAERGIGTSVHFIPLHLMPYWSKRYSLKPGDFPRALAAFEGCLSLPIWPGMGEEAVARVASEIDAICAPRRARRPFAAGATP